jgi:endonuclease III related protein
MQKKLISLYSQLLEEYGKQDWWPAESPYEVAIGAVLTQNTNWRNVEKAIALLKEAGLVNEVRMLSAPIPKLERLVRPSGFYRQKARRLKAMTRTWLRVRKMDDANEMRRALLETHGIGKETADSILLYALGKPVFVVDAYTRRFCKSMLGKEWKTYDEYKEFFEKSLPKDVEIYKEYHALIVEWGKREGKTRQLAKSARLRL